MTEATSAQADTARPEAESTAQPAPEQPPVFCFSSEPRPLWGKGRRPKGTRDSGGGSHSTPWTPQPPETEPTPTPNNTNNNNPNQSKGRARPWGRKRRQPGFPPWGPHHRGGWPPHHKRPDQTATTRPRRGAAQRDHAAGSSGHPPLLPGNTRAAMDDGESSPKCRDSKTHPSRLFRKMGGSSGAKGPTGHAAPHGAPRTRLRVSVRHAGRDPGRRRGGPAGHPKAHAAKPKPEDHWVSTPQPQSAPQRDGERERHDATVAASGEKGIEGLH